MALWQFTTLVVLIGALLVYASVIMRRLGRADARLTRIEAALLEKSHSTDSVDSPSAEIQAAEPMPVEPTLAEARPEVCDSQPARQGYLTLRDLRAQSEQPGLRAPGSGNTRAFVASLFGREAPQPPDEHSSPPVSEDSAAPATLETHDAPPTSSEQTSEQQKPPDDGPANDDSVARKNRDMMLFLNNQRRRRRARLGY